MKKVFLLILIIFAFSSNKASAFIGSGVGTVFVSVNKVISKIFLGGDYFTDDSKTNDYFTDDSKTNRYVTHD